MRTEREMFDLILDTARQDERIRAVILNGSRANPHARGDCFQDYDIVYLVTDVASFREDKDWPLRFGDIMVMQMPENMQDPPPEGNGGLVYLMQFMDGNRIDLSLSPVEDAQRDVADSLTVVLLDKDELIPPLPPPGEGDYLPKAPSQKQFDDCCNEFWWCAPYVAKGLWRQQITYSKAILDGALRDPMMKVLAWYVGTRTGFTRNPGYLGKYLEEYLEAVDWQDLMLTYSGASFEDTWESLFAMCRLFRRAALSVARACSFEYPDGDDRRVNAHLRHVRQLPRDATEIY